MIFVFLLLLPGVRVEETTPSSLLSPRNFNHHPFKSVQFLKKTSKKGPILFPNDGPPPPPTPLIVTSRPLIESIRRSELNPNNTIQAQSQINPVTFKPQFLMRNKEYKPFAYDLLATTQSYQFDNPYAQIVKKKQRDYEGYEDYEVPENSAYHNNDASEVDSNEYNHGENYAFSYTVKDHKTGDDFSHSQSSHGAATNGEYRVRLPDGRMQIVSYTADENGYKADVRYDDQDEHLKGNRLESEKNHVNLYDNNHSNNQYKTKNYKPLYTSNDNLYVDYVDKNSASKNFESNDHYSSYLITNNDQYNYNKAVPMNNDNTYKERAQDDDYYHYTDGSSREYKDYSNEFDYQPHKSKYSSFITPVESTPKSTYEELKDIFVKKFFENPRYKSVSSTLRPNFDVDHLNLPTVSSTISPNFYANRLNAQSVSSTINPTFDLTRLDTPSVSSTISPNYYTNQLNIPSVSSTFSPDFDSKTENVVVIGMKKPTLFTNIRSMLNPNTVTPSSTPQTPIVSNPSEYLISTITNLKNKINLSTKPELSSKFIDKINKYLSYK